MTWYSNSNLTDMLLVWALSFVKLLGTVLRFSSSTHHKDTRTPTNKLLTLTLRVTQKYIFSIHQIITPFIYHVSLSQKFHVPKRIVWAMLKKEGKKYIHAKRHERKKQCMLKSMKKREEINKDSSYFQRKAFIQKRVMIQGVPKIFRIRNIMKIPHTCTSWSKCMTCISLRSSFWLSKNMLCKYAPLSYLPKTPLKSLSGRIWKRQNSKMPWWGIIHNWVIERIIWGTYIYFIKKLIKPPDR